MNRDHELRAAFIALALLGAFAPLLLLSGGCAAPSAIDISTIPGMWTVIGLYLCLVLAGATIYLALSLLQRKPRPGGKKRRSTLAPPTEG